MSTAEFPSLVDLPRPSANHGRQRESSLQLVSSDRPDEHLTTDELGSRIVAIAGRLAAATCRWLLLVADFDAREGCARFGLPTTAQWLSHACGLSKRTAIEHVRVARGLALHPQLADAMSSGRLSYSHVRAISRLVRPAEHELVADLVHGAEHSTVHQLEAVVRGLRSVDDVEAGRADDPPKEYVSHHLRSDSRWKLNARLDPERGAVVQSALQTLARVTGLPLSDALVRMAEMTLSALNDSAHPPRPLRGEERAAVVIHLDAAAMGANEPVGAIDTAASPMSAQSPTRVQPLRPFAHVAGGAGLPARVVERLLCSGRVRTVLTSGHSSARSKVLDLGRSRRVVSEPQFRALLLRDQGCLHPGCTSTAGLQGHHVRHWLHGGPTDLANLILLCEAHHRAHHDGEFDVMARDGAFVFIRTSDGRELPEIVDPTQLIDTSDPIELDFPMVSDDAATTRWTGDRLDRHYAVSVFAAGRYRRNRSSAGSPQDAA